ncbi:14578_t:CDS:2, partial [Gigaspora rosea]
HCQNYIRHPRNTFNTPFDSGQLANYEKMNDHEIPNKDSFDEGETNYDNTNDYMTPNENLFNKRETDYENTNNYETPNKDSFDEVLNDNDEDFFNDEILDDYKNMNNRKTPNENLFDEQIPSINGEFAPYFKNITEVLMFFWIQKYNISTHAYEELVDIICHPQFKNEDVVANIRRFRKYRQRLPLLPIKTQNIHISNKKTPSTSKDTKE